MQQFMYQEVNYCGKQSLNAITFSLAAAWMDRVLDDTQIARAGCLSTTMDNPCPCC